MCSTKSLCGDRWTILQRNTFLYRYQDTGFERIPPCQPPTFPIASCGLPSGQSPYSFRSLAIRVLPIPKVLPMTSRGVTMWAPTAKWRLDHRPAIGKLISGICRLINGMKPCSKPIEFTTGEFTIFVATTVIHMYVVP